MPRLPTAGPLHHRRSWPDPATARARRAATGAPSPGRRPGVPGDLPAAPADGRTLPRLDHPPQPTGSLPRSARQRRLAAPAGRRDQPAPPAHPRTHRHRPPLGTRLLTGTIEQITVNDGQGDLSVAPPGADLHSSMTAARRPAP